MRTLDAKSSYIVFLAPSDDAELVSKDFDGYCQLTEPVLNWLGSNVDDDRYFLWSKSDSFWIDFLNRDDALLFKMAWAN